MCANLNLRIIWLVDLSLDPAVDALISFSIAREVSRCDNFVFDDGLCFRQLAVLNKIATITPRECDGTRAILRPQIGTTDDRCLSIVGETGTQL